jgi:predicted transcriptional regulator of viral defense system
MPAETSNTGPYVTEPASRAIDQAIAELAARQHGVVSLPQLKALGLTADAVRQRVAAGRLHRIHRGVYAVGHAKLLPKARWMAATLAIPGAVLSHQSAAALRDLMPPPSGPVHVTTTRKGARSRPGIRVHHAVELDATTIAGIPTTTVQRTIHDLAATLSTRRLERVLERAEKLKITDIEPKAGHRGAAKLRSALPEEAELRSELERKVLHLCRSLDIPEPQTNVAIQLPDGTTATVDFLWPETNLVLEADSRQHHDTARAFEEDRRRDQLLLRAGYQPLRTTDRQLKRRPEELEELLRQYSAAASLRR